MANDFSEIKTVNDLVHYNDSLHYTYEVDCLNDTAL